MQIRFLGTSAAEGWPGLFCDCEPCRKARRLGGRNVRTRSSIQVDGLLKVDLPPDTYHHVLSYGLQLHRLRYLLITHSHGDHCAGGELDYIQPPFAYADREADLEVYGNPESLAKFNRGVDWSPSPMPARFTEVAPFETLDLDPFEVTTVRARHGSDAYSLNYIIRRNGRSFLYACDTGFYEEASWDFLAGRRMDLIISECTNGPDRTGRGATHMGLPNVQDFRRRAEEIGLADADTRWALTHFSHGGRLVYDELVPLAEPLDLEVAYDGMVIDL